MDETIDLPKFLWGGLKKPHIFLKMKYNLASLYENASLKHVNFDYVLNSQI